MSQLPLAVDLDGTLIRNDLIEETVIRFLIERPWRIFLILYWWSKGRAHLKQKVAQRVLVDVTLLPYREEVLAWLREQGASGRKLLLVSGSDQSYVTAIADHLKIFSQAKGSDGKTNCIGSKKAAWLVDQFGEKGFDYAGNSRVDRKVWARAQEAVVVHPASSAFSDLLRISKRFTVARLSPLVLFKTLRAHQWVKALLVFVPLFAAHRVFDVDAVTAAIKAFFSFSFISSATYVLNDIVDLESDRQHPKKRSRPLASGLLRPWLGLLLSILLVVSSLTIASQVSLLFLALIVAYGIGTLVYSLFAKSWVIADIVLLSGFYTLRILGGGVACDIDVSRWLLLFSIFFFLSLACVKRFCELASLGKLAASRRDYQQSDLPLIRVMGLCSGFIAVLVIALWANSYEVEVIYQSPQLLWLLCPLLLYWVGRIWLLAERGVMHHDPVVFALKDGLSYLIAALALFLVYMGAAFSFSILQS